MRCHSSTSASTLLSTKSVIIGTSLLKTRRLVVCGIPSLSKDSCAIILSIGTHFTWVHLGCATLRAGASARSVPYAVRTSGRNSASASLQCSDARNVDGEYLVHPTTYNNLKSIFRTGLAPGALRKTIGPQLQGFVCPTVWGKRTTVHFSIVNLVNGTFKVRKKMELLVVFSATAVTNMHECWQCAGSNQVSTPRQIRPDLILAVLTAGNVIYKDNACPAFVITHIAPWWTEALALDQETELAGRVAAANLKMSREFNVMTIQEAIISVTKQGEPESQDKTASKVPKELRKSHFKTTTTTFLVEAPGQAPSPMDIDQEAVKTEGATSSVAPATDAAMPPPEPIAPAVEQDKKEDKPSEEEKKDEEMPHAPLCSWRSQGKSLLLLLSHPSVSGPEYLS